MSAQSARRYHLSSSQKDKRQSIYNSVNKKTSHQEIDQSGLFSNKNDEDSISDQHKSIYSLKNSQMLEKSYNKKYSILGEHKQIDFFDAKNIKSIIEKERKSPTDLIHLGAALKNYWFFDDYKRTLPFSNYISLLKSIEYQFVKKGEIVYSIGQKSTEIFVILEGSFFVMIRNPKSLVVYNTPRAAQQVLNYYFNDQNKLQKCNMFYYDIKQQLEQNQQNQNNNNTNNINNQQPQAQPQQQQQSQQQQDQAQTNKQKQTKNVDFSQAWEYIEQQSLQDEINKKMQQMKDKDQPLEWFEICDELSDTILVDSLKLGNNFGEFELMYNKLRSQIIIAREDSHLIKINQQQYELLPKEKNQKQYNASLEFLYSFDFFHDWGRQMMNLLVCFEITECYLNQVIYKESEESDFLYFVYSGEFEISKKIKPDLNHQKVLELANIPLFNYKKFIKSQIKHGGDYSERVRLCIYGPNTYFGDEELLYLDKRKTQATCISQEGVLYKLSLKIVCNQNNIWEILQENLKIKRKWQKQLFSLLNEDGPVKQVNEQSSINIQQSQQESVLEEFPSFLSNIKFQSKPYYKGFKDNYSHNIQNVYSGAANNIITLQQKKLFSPRSSPSNQDQNYQKQKKIRNKEMQDNFNQHLKNIQEGTNKCINLQNYQQDYISQNSPIHTTRFFNLKQELLNKNFFQDRSKNLIQIQQNMLLVKRFKDHQNNLKSIDHNDSSLNQLQQQSKSPLSKSKDQIHHNKYNLSNNQNINNNKKQSFLLTSLVPIQQESQQSCNGEIESSSNNNIRNQQGQQNSGRKRDYKIKKINIEKEQIRSDNQLSEQKEQTDRSFIIRKEDLGGSGGSCLDNVDRHRSSSEKGIQIDLRIFHENTNEENFLKKKDLWDHLQNSQEKITSQQFYDQLMDAVNGGKRPQTKGDTRQKSMYKGKAVRDACKRSLNSSNLSKVIGESSIGHDKSLFKADTPSRSTTPIQDNNTFRQYYNQNKDLQTILDKLKFYRFMKPSKIDQNLLKDPSLLQHDISLCTNQIPVQNSKMGYMGSQTSRDSYRSRSAYDQINNNYRRQSAILELKQELFGMSKSQVLKQQQFLILGNHKQSINTNYYDSIDLNTPILSIQESKQLSSKQALQEQQQQQEEQQEQELLRISNNLSSITKKKDICDIQDNKKETYDKQVDKRELLQLSPLKNKQHLIGEKIIQQKLELQINNKLNIPTHNRVFKQGDIILRKTGGFTLKKPCPSRFINQL